MKLLIAYDGSECADAALAELTRAGLPPDTQAIVLSVADVWPALPASPDQSLDPTAMAQLPVTLQKVHALAAQASAEARALAEQAAGRLRGSFPQWQIQTEVRSGSPPNEILKCADEQRVNLIVVGAQGRSALGRLVFGSISQKVVHYATCSVRVARSGTKMTGPVKLLVGVDGSDSAAVALSAVAQRSWPAGTEVRLVAAADLRLSSALPPGGDPDPRQWLQSILEQAAGNLHDAGLHAVPLLLEGDPKRILVEQAAQWPADCLFVGAKGMTGLDRFLLGSVSAALASRAPCSVEICRAGRK